MKLCRFHPVAQPARIGLLLGDDRVLDLSPVGIATLTAVLEAADPGAQLRAALGQDLPVFPLSGVTILPPVERQEVWAAGVTYLRSKTARMEESDFSATAYDRVYAAVRPEIFFKSAAEKVVGPGDPVGIRRDARWSVPEPELALVLNSRGELAGVTIGNDMSSRDIEGENLLYLPQAKIYARSCALGPAIALGVTEAEVRAWQVAITISRGATAVFRGETSLGQIKRSFSELIEHLFRAQEFPHGAVLLTGTGVVPPDSFTLHPGDEITIAISGLGELRNSVVTV